MWAYLECLIVLPKCGAAPGCECTSGLGVIGGNPGITVGSPTTSDTISFSISILFCSI